MTAPLFVGPRWSAACATLLAFVLAGTIHGALAWVEVRYFPDPTWAAIMEDASLAKARAELADRIAHARRLGEALPSEAEQRRLLEELERTNRPWPLDPVLVTALAAAILAGAIRGGRDDRTASLSPALAGPPSTRAIGTTLALLVLALGVIVVVR